jgi:7-cyano-7-deazaguanine tRNA-ribosyltransferase
MEFEILSRDAAGRVCKISENNKKIKTPTIAIVVNPNKMTLSIKELKKAGVELIITNAYILWKSRFKEEILEKGLHKFFKWRGFIYTDSGTYQMFSHGIKDLDNETMVSFQMQIKSDFVTPVDVFTLPSDSKEVAAKKLRETLERIKVAKSICNEKLVCPIQGGMYIDLRKEACEFANNIGARVFAIGGIVPLMNEYRYKELLDIVLACKTTLNPSIPTHAFGAGHPITFALLAACGVDIFDSAMYSLAAAEDRYLTPHGTKNLFELEELPCNCEVCRKYSAEDVKKAEKHERERLLALHNLYVTLEEIKRIRQAIHEQSLWELVQIRARSHPKILAALLFALQKYRKWFEENDMFPKKRGIFYSGKETELRPEITKAKRRLATLSARKLEERKPFGKIPRDLIPAYPFLQFEGLEEFEEVEVDWKKYFKLLLEYQFGEGASKAIGDFELEFARTGKPRRVFVNKVCIGTISAETGFFLPNLNGAILLKEFMKKVFVKKEAEPFVRKGRNLLAKFAYTREKILPGEEVIVCNEEGEIIACGKALLNYREINLFERGVAVKIRDSLNK